jgi:hypothetical protein
MRKLEEVDIRAVVKAHIKKHYGTQKAAADAWGLSAGYVSDVLNGNRMMPDVMANDAGYELVHHVAEWVKTKKVTK